MRTQIVLCSISILAAACATTPNQGATGGAIRPRPSSIPLQQRVSTSDPIADSAALRSALEASYGKIIARSQSTKANLPIVDAEAALSIEIPDHPKVQGAVNYFSTGLKPSIQESLHRSARYKLLIDSVLDEYGVPRAFAYLPVIESAYLPTLTSKAGARGIWQLMPDTAREYGLRVDWWVDERTDAEKSTRVAARFIRDLWNQFHDWPLVLAAYNAGPGRVRRTLASTGSTTFWEMLEQSALPKETRGYVPTFFATLVIVGDPDAYGFTLKEPKLHEEKGIMLHGPVSFDYLARLTGVSVDDLQELNPEFRRAMLPPGRARIKLPATAASIVAARAESLRHEDPYIALTTYTLRHGDSVTKLAKLLGRAEDDILAMNGLASNRVSVGDAIYLPVQQARLSTLLSDVNSPADRFHFVAAGETLYTIARNNGLTVEELVDLNQLGSATAIQPGQRLRVKLGSTLTGGM